MVFGKIAEN